ncbi:MAG: glycine cleavage system protein GcvH [Candidatus Eremiobacteraeota bacterium]|nr:glycine cleavage system protein GcvH [Candidatus Eremiobacteraeota bacterium]
MNREELKYSKEHEWVHAKGDVATVGITHYAQDQLGEIVYIELPETGQTFSKMDKVGTIESVKTVSDLFTPIAGEIIELNPSLLDRIGGEENPDFHPEFVNQEPYDKGWIFKIRMPAAADLEELMAFNDYKALIGEDA